MESSSAPARGARPAGSPPVTPGGGIVRLDGEEHYRISAYSRMAPFLVSLASDTDLWMYVASGGGLTAGRVDPDGSLFPYLTVDRLHDAHHHTGPLTLVRVERPDGESLLWEPFAAPRAELPGVERNLYKNTLGSRIVFEEIDHELELAFRYAWSGCDEFGWVRSATLTRLGETPLRVTLLDGLRNVLPHGAPLALYQQASNLVDAYKKSEVDADTGLAIFSLTAGITDRAEALESLRANIVCCSGLRDYSVHLSASAIEDFRRGRALAESPVLNGARGNYLLSFPLELGPGEARRWRIVADAGRDHVQIAARRRQLRRERDLEARIAGALREATTQLLRNVASADGLQRSGHPEATAHHLANVLFNNMRGGVFARNYELPREDFAAFLEVRNRAVARRQAPRVADLPAAPTVHELLELARGTDDADFERLCHEYLPLYFGRRHGDPSRPWNRFSIRARNGHGERVLSYEGNWRDIFQNWEALCEAFPGFLPNIIAKFVNASTVDGFNPYRISQDGVDWETVSADDPWSNIGYWGDHQIVYLLRLLESQSRHDPRRLVELLGREIFSYAEVPYRIRPYADILRDCRDTIDFDAARARRIDGRVDALGTDGKLWTSRAGDVYHVNLLEKLLVPALAKLSNLIPDAGIWMNTQRPEWNDANNALAAGGVSVVTLCHLRRYLAYLSDLLADLPAGSLPVSTEVVAWFERIADILARGRSLLAAERLEPGDRKRMLDELGEAFSDYRTAVYDGGFTGKTELALGRVRELCATALEHLEWGLRANRREDGLYHSYNLLDFAAGGGEVRVVRLAEMLEGQVAALASGLVGPEEALPLLERLFESDLYSEQQKSFTLYPARELPGFLAKNAVPEPAALAIPLVAELLAAGDGALVARDADGVLRFDAAFVKAADLQAALAALAEEPRWSAAVDRDRAAILELYETVFHHRSYLGRSGVMVGYEGQGCIYWHMVAKLLLAAQELQQLAERTDRPAATREGLAAQYFRIRAGFGFERSAAEFGTFPTDPYSHTPPSGGAKQPGMTGQVKESILARMGELGIRVDAGAVHFEPTLLPAAEFLTEPEDFRCFGVDGEALTIPLPAGSLAFTFCQVPVVYERGSGPGRIRVEFADGSTSTAPGSRLDAQLSAELFARSGRIARLHVELER